MKSADRGPTIGLSHTRRLQRRSAAARLCASTSSFAQGRRETPESGPEQVLHERALTCLDDDLSRHARLHLTRAERFHAFGRNGNTGQIVGGNIGLVGNEISRNREHLTRYDETR